MKRISLLILVLSLSCSVFADEETYKQLYNNAKQAIETEDEAKKDFYLARYMGLTFLDKETERNLTDLYPLLKNHRVSKPTSIISGRYSNDFIDWFAFSSIAMWGRDDDEDIDVETQSFGIVSNANDEYFATVIASPYVEGWFIVKNDETKTLIMTLMDSERKPSLTLGRHKNSVPLKLFEEKEIDTGGHPIQYIWPIEFHDLDNDGIPEIWLRYNATWATGFSQMLDIYKIKDNENVILLKRFEGHAEGIARRLDNNRIEIAYGFTNKEATGHMGYDKHHFEIWEYKDGEFVKASERDEAHILWSNKWQKYYFTEE